MEVTWTYGMIRPSISTIFSPSWGVFRHRDRCGQSKGNPMLWELAAVSVTFRPSPPAHAPHCSFLVLRVIALPHVLERFRERLHLHCAIDVSCLLCKD